MQTRTHVVVSGDEEGPEPHAEEAQHGLQHVHARLDPGAGYHVPDCQGRRRVYVCVDEWMGVGSWIDVMLP